MKSYHLYIITILLLSFCSCNKELQSNEVQLISLNPDQIIKEHHEIMASSIMDSIRYIPLETTPKSIFSQIDKMEVTTDFFFILDRRTNAILLFNRTGKFFNRINNVQLGINSQLKIKDFTVDKEEKKIIVYVDRMQKILVLNYAGKLLKTIELNSNFKALTTINPNTFALYNGYKGNENDYNINFINYDNKIEKSALPFSKQTIIQDDIINSPQNFFSSADTTFFTPEYGARVYKLIKNKVTLAYQFEFPKENSLPDDFLDNGALLGGRRKYLNRVKNIYYKIVDFYKVENRLFFTLLNSNKTSVAFMYNIKGKTSHLMPRIINDINLLPVIPHLIAADGKIAYTSSSALFIKKTSYMVVSEMKKSSEMSSKIRQLPTIEDANQNPVLTEFIFKKNVN